MIDPFTILNPFPLLTYSISTHPPTHLPSFLGYISRLIAYYIDPPLTHPPIPFYSSRFSFSTRTSSYLPAYLPLLLLPLHPPTDPPLSPSLCLSLFRSFVFDTRHGQNHEKNPAQDSRTSSHATAVTQRKNSIRVRYCAGVTGAVAAASWWWRTDGSVLVCIASRPCVLL